MLSPCMLCKAECCRNHLITVTSFDVLRLHGDGYGVPDFAQFAPCSTLNFDNDMVLEFHDSGLAEDYLLAFRSNPCYFLVNGRCEIHGIAPSVCKAYPKNASGKMMGRLCPGIPKLMHGVLGTEIRKEYAKEIEIYREIVTEWNRGRGRMRDCMPFLLERTEEAANLMGNK
ncbi:MAG: YkgJ family cysteine cluster protein [Candidatus ainarchaeum sp.]|nr:YkgJ family cysteine cluster protein [Candidatus ainarchaeum sp.]MDD5096293.1 YkgJ family cysteine cluster protein [Candidatus ainarchaeum sp.]